EESGLLDTGLLADPLRAVAHVRSEVFREERRARIAALDRLTAVREQGVGWRYAPGLTIEPIETVERERRLEDGAVPRSQLVDVPVGVGEQTAYVRGPRGEADGDIDPCRVQNEARIVAPPIRDEIDIARSRDVDARRQRERAAVGDSGDASIQHESRRCSAND